MTPRASTRLAADAPVEEGDEGDKSPVRRKAPTLADVALAAGVSTATASRVLAGRGGGAPASADRVREAATRLGFDVPTSQPFAGTASSRLIGVIVTDVEDPYYARLVNAIERVGRADGYGALLCNADYDVRSVKGFMRALEAREVDGVVLSVAKLDTKSAPWLAGYRVPIVLVDCVVPGLKAPAISSDNRLGGRLAIDHLIGLGHRRIAMIMPPRTVLAARERLAGARDGMRWAGAQDALAVVVARRYDLEAGSKAMTTVLREHPDVTAVFAFNDAMAIGAADAIRRAGMSIPDDISIMGFDDLPVAEYSSPPLTTIRQSVDVMGRWAYRQLRRELAARGRDDTAAAEPDADWAEFQRAPVELRVRQSTARPRAPEEPGRA